MQWSWCHALLVIHLHLKYIFCTFKYTYILCTCTLITRFIWLSMPKAFKLQCTHVKKQMTEAKSVHSPGRLPFYSSFCLFFSLFIIFSFLLLLFLFILEVDEDFKAVLIKRLTFGKGELLESHAWSSDDQIFAVAGCKIYLSKVSIILSQEFLTQKTYLPVLFLNFTVLFNVVFLIRSVRDLPAFIPLPCITCQKTFP